MPEHLDTCYRQSFGDYGREWAVLEGSDDDPCLPDNIYFWKCNPWCEVLRRHLDTAQKAVEGDAPPTSSLSE